jgi:lipoyl(octanoyl) transferase
VRPDTPPPAPVARILGRRSYRPVWEAMRRFTETREPATPDEIWYVEHDPVYTLGLNGRREHVLDPREIEVVHVDRGGQVTYHGPGQIVAYTLLDLRRRGLGPQELVALLEEAILRTLAAYGVAGRRVPGAPGVYVGEAKIASLGLRIRRGASYHGLAFNVAMDLEPFARIDPCGYRGLAMTDLARLAPGVDPEEVRLRLDEQLRACLAESWARKARTQASLS